MDECCCTCADVEKSDVKLSNLHDSEKAAAMSLWSSGLNKLPYDGFVEIGVRCCFCIDSIQFEGLQPSCAQDRVRARKIII